MRRAPFRPPGASYILEVEKRHRILLTGASGYVGGRLLRALEARGHSVRCLARHPDFVASRAAPGTTVVRGDCLDADSLRGVCDGIEVVYYLVHSMASPGDFAARDRAAARNLGDAARIAGVRRIIYLGGLGDRDHLSQHLRSRHETGAVLRASGVPVVELRSGIVLGSGSLSFELIRALVERLPVMVCPTWIRTPTQPIAVEDLIAYLMAALHLRNGASRTFEVGGAEQVSYREIMLEYARQRGLRRRLIPVPLLSPRLSSLWLGLTTPVYARIGRRLIDGLRNATVVRDRAARDAFVIRPMGLRRAIARAIANEDHHFAVTRWSDAVSSTGLPSAWGGVRIGPRLFDTRSLVVDAPPAAAFAPIRRIGGRNGWYGLDWLWQLRGAIDLLLGGVGMRRGRRDPDTPAVGDPLDCWRVEAYEPNARLRLAAEMKLPGRAWLEFEVEPHGATRSIIRQTSVIEPAGLLGLCYWYGIYPAHARIFGGMLRGIAGRAIAIRPGYASPGAVLSGASRRG